MKNWKKGIVVLAALVGLAACAGNAPATKENEQTKEETAGAKVVASIYPLYDWARTLAEGTSIETDYLVDHGDLHAYEPSADDIVKARAASLLLAVGGVDEDEEAVDMVKFKEAYSLASKVVSVMQEIYDKLIQETGV